MSVDRFNPNQKRRLADGASALERYLEAVEADGLAALTDDERLMLRAVRSLAERLQNPNRLSPTNLSPADCWMLRDLAAKRPADRELLLDLHGEIVHLRSGSAKT